MECVVDDPWGMARLWEGMRPTDDWPKNCHHTEFIGQLSPLCRFWFLLLALAFVKLPIANATSISSPASTSARQVQYMISEFLAEGGDIDTLSMQRIVDRMDVDTLSIANSYVQGRLVDRFELLGGRGPVDPETHARMLGYTANEIRDGGKRFVFWLLNEEVYFDVDSSERVSRLLANEGMILVDRGVWAQPSLWGPDLFHLSGSPAPLNESRVLEDRAGRRLPESSPGTSSLQSSMGLPTVDEAQASGAKRMPGVATKKLGAAKLRFYETMAWLAAFLVPVAAIFLSWWLLKRMKRSSKP